MSLLRQSCLFIAVAFISHLSLAEKRDRLVEHVVVSSTGEEKLKSEVAASIYAITEEEIRAVAPSHPADLLNSVPGVHINNLGGEGHMSSIRQPISTSAVYLFLEDGIPTRPTGFFNHNGLYEINIPQSDRVEVIKGPGSALYGSGAIGGVINVVTKASPKDSRYAIDLESGANSWMRMLMDGGARVNNNLGVRVDVNVTENEGFRDESDYDRISSNVRFDGIVAGDWASKTVLSYSEVNQSGASSLEFDDYQHNPEKNRFHGDIGFREVEATRVSMEIKREDEDSATLITPYYRNNMMEMMPSWMVTYDPNIRHYEFQSYGLLLRNRLNFSPEVSVVVGVDLDYTPSQYEEERIAFSDDDLITTEINGRTVIDTYLDYTPTDILNYDFEAEQFSVSPYLHGEWRFYDKWLMSSGIRYDYFEVDYTNNLTTVDAVDRQRGLNHIRPESQKLSYDEFSPKWSLLYEISSKHNAYLNYRHSFVSPSIGTLFRPGSSIESTSLKPVTADSVELGLRGFFANDNYQYELAIYTMAKKNDIISIIDGGDRRLVNAGETDHKGIELGLKGDISAELGFSVAYTYTKQKYEDFRYVFQCFSPVCGRDVSGPPIVETRNFSGYEIGKAPKSLANVSFHYAPNIIEGLRFSVEFNHVGSYFTDETNTQSYDGHDLYNLRMQYAMSNSLSLHFRVMNITDELHSTYTSNQVTNPEISYRPGLPRTSFLGIRAKF